jgi:Ca-activated chloride channel homolog
VEGDLMRLNMTLKPHRSCLPAHTDNKLFIAFELLVDAGTPPAASGQAGDQARVGLGVLLLVDTSGSMTYLRPRDVQSDFGNVPMPAAGESRLDVVIDGLRKLVVSGQLRASDQVAIMAFNDQVYSVIPFTPAAETRALSNALEQLRQFSGGTLLGAALQSARGALGRGVAAAERVVLFTDGNTMDEDVVHQAVGELEAIGVPVIAMGIGADWKAELLTEVSDRTHGVAYHLVNDEQLVEDSQASDPVSRLPELLQREVVRATSEYLTEVQVLLGTARGVTLTRVTQVEPTISETPVDSRRFALGNVGSAESKVFLLEFDVEARPPSRARLAQIGLSYRAVNSQVRAEAPPRDLVIEFSADESRTAETDQSVLDFVVARNVTALMDQAVALADSDPVRSAALLRQAEQLTQKVNPALTSAVRQATIQLSSGKTLSLSARKTLQVGAKTKTIRSQGLGGLSDEEISRLTGI